MNTTNSGATQAGTQDVVPAAPELKPCPFCGSPIVKQWKAGSCVVCHNCGAEGPVAADHFLSHLSVHDAWNARTPITAPVAPTWQPIADAPQKPGFTCDIWSASEQRRFTDCFWDKSHWSYEDFDCDHYRVRRVPDPVAFIPCPEAPDFGA